MTMIIMIDYDKNDDDNDDDENDDGQDPDCRPPGQPRLSRGDRDQVFAGAAEGGQVCSLLSRHR